MKLFLVRHGETDWNVQKRIQGRTDTDLNDTGRRQARQLGEKLLHQRLKISKVYASKLKRAYETATIVGDCIDVNVETLDGLEEMDLGLWEGLTWSQVRVQYPEEYKQWFDNRRYQRTPQGESYQVVLERVLKALHRIIEKEEEDVLVVTHSADIVTLLAAIREIPFSSMWETIKVGNVDVVEVESNEIKKICH